MSTLPLLPLSLLVLFADQPADACDLEISIRTHAQELVFGDPLYVEVTIVNRGKEVMSAPRPIPQVNTFALKFHDPETDMVIGDGGGGGCYGLGKPLRLEPGKPVKSYWYFFVPPLYRFNHPFWKRIRDGRGFWVYGVYKYRPRVAFISKSVHLYVEPRKESEIAALVYWTKADLNGHVRGPTPADFGIPFRSGLNREQAHELAFNVTSGELGDLFHLSAEFRDLYEVPPDSRRAANRKLIERLRKQPAVRRQGAHPDVKRYALAWKLRDLAASYNMGSTVKALQTLENEKGDKFRRPDRDPARVE